MYYVLNANLHRLFLHTGWDNLWNDAWRHQNRLRTSISGEFEKLTLVTNSSDQPAKHPRSNIRLGKEGAEAGEPHWGAQQGGWPKWRWSVLDGHLNFPLLPFYVKIFLLDKVCLVLSIKVSNWPPRALKLLLYVRCILYLGILSEYWPPLVITDHKASIIFNHSLWSLFLHWLTCQLKVNAFICLQ